MSMMFGVILGAWLYHDGRKTGVFVGLATLCVLEAIKMGLLTKG